MGTTTDYVNNAHDGREADVRALYERIENQDDDARTELDELPLGVEVERHIVITLATGGPHEQIDATVDEDGSILSTTFGAYWGSDRIERELHPDDALYRLAQEFAEYHAL